MPFGCFGGSQSAAASAAEQQFRRELDQVRAQLAAKEEEAAALKREFDELTRQPPQSTVGEAGSEDGLSANALRLEIERLSQALAAKESEASAASGKVKAAQAEALEAKRQLEKERLTSRLAGEAQASAAAATAKVTELEKQLEESKVTLAALAKDLNAARQEAATARNDETAAREEAKSTADQLAKVLAEQSKAVADAEARASEVAQEAAASTVAAAAEMAEKAAAASRQQVDALRAELIAHQARLDAAEKAIYEAEALRRQVHDLQHHLAAATAELTAAKELREDAAERIAEYQRELEDANLARQGLHAERQMLAEQVDQLTADRTRLEAQVQELEANLLDAVTAANIAVPMSPMAPQADSEVAAVARGMSQLAAASSKGGEQPAVARSAGGASNGTQGSSDRAGPELGKRSRPELDPGALAAQLAEAQAEVHDLRRELERTIVAHEEGEEALQTENEVLKGQVEELRVALGAAESRVSELEIAQALKDQLSAQLGNTQYALEEALGSMEALRTEIQGLQQERAALQTREDEARDQVQNLQQQLKEAQMRSVELVTANADRQIELAKLRSEVASQGLLSDSNAQMAAKLLADYQSLKDEHARLRNELRSKDEMMALLQDQLSSLTNIDYDAMLKQIENVQSRKVERKKAPPPMEAIMAAAGLTGRATRSTASAGSATSGSMGGAPPTARETGMSNGGAAPGVISRTSSGGAVGASAGNGALEGAGTERT